MSREVKRVPVGFDWPLNKVWSGYLMPDTMDLPTCGDCAGDGYTPEARAIAKSFYSFQTGDSRLSWSDKIGQAEVDNLLAEGRLKTWQFQPVKSCTFVGSENTWDISVPYRNTYLANGFVSHNTISFVMDCDTTGIEPELALVKYKLLAGGGNMKLVNSCVAEALTVLGYTEKAREAILAYVEEKGVVEGAPGIKDEHLAVFDTSFVSPNGTRSIAWMAHLDMMIAAQPFISGAISKTVNMPEGTTVAEIREAIFYGWRGNLKAQALYRDGSKYSQPLSAKEGGNNKTGNEATNAAQQAANLELRGSRRKLPKTRDSITHHFNVGGHDGYVTAGMYEDGTLGEIFVKMNKEGSTIAGLMDTISILTSIGIQHGVPLPLLVEKLSYLDFEPRGMTGDPDVPTARSVVDYVFRWLGTRFKVLNGLYQVMEDDDSYSEISTLKGVWTVSVSAGEDRHTVLTKQKETVTGPPCPTCGSMTVRTGPCFSCHNCGNSTGGCG
jgi:ribonucleoside-diphosphate reductase alpha chain